MEVTGPTFSANIIKIVNEGCKHYQKGNYSHALNCFQSCISNSPQSEYFLLPFIIKCRQVLSAKDCASDLEYLKNKKMQPIVYIIWGITLILSISLCNKFNYENKRDKIGEIINYAFQGPKPFLSVALVVLLVYCSLKLFIIVKPTPGKGYRCKYCGHYTQYIRPNEPTLGFANTNSCEICERMYPMPDVYWDSWEGLDYINKRHSVPDQAFYTEYDQLIKERIQLHKKYFE